VSVILLYVIVQHVVVKAKRETRKAAAMDSESVTDADFTCNCHVSDSTLVERLCACIRDALTHEGWACSTIMSCYLLKRALERADVRTRVRLGFINLRGDPPVSKSHCWIQVVCGAYGTEEWTDADVATEIDSALSRRFEGVEAQVETEAHSNSTSSTISRSANRPTRSSTPQHPIAHDSNSRSFWQLVRDLQLERYAEIEASIAFAEHPRRVCVLRRVQLELEQITNKHLGL